LCHFLKKKENKKNSKKEFIFLMAHIYNSESDGQCVGHFSTLGPEQNHFSLFGAQVENKSHAY
jgi:hypothetical protein